MFLLNRSFTRSHHRYLVHVRMSQTLSGAGPSIVGTQMAQAVVFTVAAIVSPFPAVTNMSIFTVVATVFQLLFQVSKRRRLGAALSVDPAMLLPCLWLLCQR